MKSWAPCYITHISENDSLELMLLLQMAFQSTLRHISQYEEACVWTVLLGSRTQKARKLGGWGRSMKKNTGLAIAN